MKPRVSLPPRLVRGAYGPSRSLQRFSPLRSTFPSRTGSTRPRSECSTRISRSPTTILSAGIAPADRHHVFLTAAPTITSCWRMASEPDQASSSGGVVQAYPGARPRRQLQLGAHLGSSAWSSILNFPATPFAYIRWTESSTGRGQRRGGRRAALLGKSGRSLHVERRDADAGHQPHQAALSSNPTTPRFPATPAPTTARRMPITTAACWRFGPDGKLYLFMGDQGRRAAGCRICPTGRF